MVVFDTLNSNNGWFVGNFPKTVLTTSDFEVSYKEFKKGEKSDGHHHTQSTEYNLVVKGLVYVNSWITLYPGMGFVYLPYDKSDVEFLEDSALVVIRVPSVNDKEYDEKADDSCNSRTIST